MKTNYKNLLTAAMERAKYEPESIAYILAKYDGENARTGDERTAFETIVKQFGDEAIETALASEPIQLPESERSPLYAPLEKISNENRIDVSRNARMERLRSIIQRKKDDVASLDCEVVLSAGELANMPAHQRESLERAEKIRKAGYQVTIPKALQPNYEATAQAFKDGSFELEIKS